MNQNYICYTKQKDPKAKALCLAMLISSCILFFLSTQLPIVKGILQILSFLLLFPFLQITNKYLLTLYQYGLEGEMLLLSSRQGKRTKNLGSLSIDKNSILLTEKEFLKRKESYRIKHRFSYCQNLFSEDKYYLLSPENEGFLLLVFEPDKTLITLLNQRISG